MFNRKEKRVHFLSCLLVVALLISHLASGTTAVFAHNLATNDDSPQDFSVQYEWNIDRDFTRIQGTQAGHIQPVTFNLTIDENSGLAPTTPVLRRWVRDTGEVVTTQNPQTQTLAAMGIDPADPQRLTSNPIRPTFGPGNAMLNTVWSSGLNGDWRLEIIVDGALIFTTEPFTVSIVPDPALLTLDVNFNVYQEELNLLEWQNPLTDIPSPLSVDIDFGQVPELTTLTPDREIRIDWWRTSDNGPRYNIWDGFTLEELGIDLTDPDSLTATIDPWYLFIMLAEQQPHFGLARWLGGTWELGVRIYGTQERFAQSIEINIDHLPLGSVFFERVNFDPCKEANTGDLLTWEVDINTEVDMDRVVFRWVFNNSPQAASPIFGNTLEGNTLTFNLGGFLGGAGGVQPWLSGRWELLAWTYALDEHDEIDWYNVESYNRIASILNVDDTLEGDWCELITDPDPTCPVMIEGSFAGASGSAWRICADGTLEIDEGVINWTGALSPWHNHRGLITQIEITGPITAGASLRALFRELTEVEEINGLTYFDTTATTSMYRMFFGLSGVTELDVTNFATNNVTNMALMFRDASSLVELDVSNFDTSNVVDMREMFRGTSIETLDLGSFDTGNAMNMNQMFTALHTLRALTLGESFSFIGSPNLVPLRQTEEFTGLWQGDSVALTSAQLMAQFEGSTMAGTFIRQAWTEKDPEICYIEARGRFANGATIGGAQWHLCHDGTLEVGSGFINWTLVTSPWHAIREEITEIVFTGEVIAGSSLRSLFHDLENLAEIHNLSYLDTSQTTNMARMFRGASSLTDLDLSTFDTSNVTDMSWMFFGASGLEALDVTNFATNNVTNMALMFREVSSLTELDVSNFDTSNVTDMREMFRGMSSLTTLNLDHFDTSNVMNMNHMFIGMSALTELILGDLFTPIGSPGIP